MKNKNKDFVYKLVAHSYKNGSGYIVVRIKDDQRLSHWTLPIEDGLESIPVSGESHHIKELQHKHFAFGSEVLLIPEPDNPYSKNAIGVLDKKQKYKVGYIPKEEEKRILKRISEDWLKKAIVMWEIREGRQRVSIRLLLIGQNASLYIP